MKNKYLKDEYTKSLRDAAPDLLEALEGVIDDLYDWCDDEGDSEFNRRVQKCKDAIIKATMIHSVYVDDMDIIKKHYCAAAVPEAIEALDRLVYLKSIKETNRAEHDANKEEAWKQASSALRAVRGEELA